MTAARRAILCIFIGIIAGFFCQEILKATNSHGDFFVAMRMARDLRAGRDPYASPVWEDFISYPLPAALVSLPMSFLPDPLSSGVFMGLSSALLAWLILKHGKPWRLAMFLSWPFAYAIFFAQWTPLVTCLWFSPLLASVVLVKPQIAIPMFFTEKPDWRGLAVAVALGVLSLLIYPSWPWVFLKQTAGYKGILPPFFVLPLGPLMVLALLRWRTRRAWLLLLMALMPQRVIYDQLPLLLVASTWRQLLFLVLVSWSTVPALLHFGGWNSVPGGWQTWILATLYVPALFVVLLGQSADKRREDGALK
jgi:hypothetical protein